MRTQVDSVPVHSSNHSCPVLLVCTSILPAILCICTYLRMCNLYSDKEIGIPLTKDAVILPGEVVVVVNGAMAFVQSFGFSPDFEIIDSDPIVPDMVKYGSQYTICPFVGLYSDREIELILNPSNTSFQGISPKPSDSKGSVKTPGLCRTSD